jgi:hypothetical protein
VPRTAQNVKDTLTQDLNTKVELHQILTFNMSAVPTCSSLVAYSFRTSFEIACKLWAKGSLLTDCWDSQYMLFRTRGRAGGKFQQDKADADYNLTLTGKRNPAVQTEFIMNM